MIEDLLPLNFLTLTEERNSGCQREGTRSGNPGTRMTKNKIDIVCLKKKIGWISNQISCLDPVHPSQLQW